MSDINYSWPWKDIQSGAVIQPDRWYGFLDSGGLAGDLSGYERPGRAYEHIMLSMRWNISDAAQNMGWRPEQLGDKAVCVLSGAAYVARLQWLAENVEGEELGLYGSFIGLGAKRSAWESKAMATILLDEALYWLDELGQVVTVWQEPRKPLAMGNAVTMIQVRPKRGHC